MHLLEHIGDESEAKETCFDIWFNSSVDDLFDDTIKDVLSRYPAMKSKKKELTSYVLKFYENMNTSEFNGYSIAYARKKGIQGKGKHRIRRGFME